MNQTSRTSSCFVGVGHVSIVTSSLIQTIRYAAIKSPLSVLTGSSDFSKRHHIFSPCVFFKGLRNIVDLFLKISQFVSLFSSWTTYSTWLLCVSVPVTFFFIPSIKLTVYHDDISLKSFGLRDSGMPLFDGCILVYFKMISKPPKRAWVHFQLTTVCATFFMTYCK